MTLQQLEYIVAVARYHHFGQAAEQCAVTQPTLSVMVAKLEAELGVKIFNRSTQPIELTQIGAEIVQIARQTLEMARGINQLVDEQRSGLQGHLTIGVLPTIAPYLLPRFFPRLMGEYPQLKLRVEEVTTTQMTGQLRERTIDVGIVAQVDGLDEFLSHSLYYEQYFAYVAESSPISALEAVKTADLANEPLWLLDQGHCFSDMLVRYCHFKNVVKTRGVYHLGSIETFMRMVEGGRGVTFIPELCTLQLTDQQKRLVRPFALPVPTRHVMLICNRDFVRTRVIQTLIEAVRSCVPSHMLSLATSQVRI